MIDCSHIHQEALTHMTHSLTCCACSPPPTNVTLQTKGSGDCNHRLPVTESFIAWLRCCVCPGNAMRVCLEYVLMRSVPFFLLSLLFFCFLVRVCFACFVCVLCVRVLRRACGKLTHIQTTFFG